MVNSLSNTSFDRRRRADSAVVLKGHQLDGPFTGEKRAEDKNVRRKIKWQ
jgi:hypothetical protein